MKIRIANTDQIIPYALLPLSPQVIERLASPVLAENIEITGYFTGPLQHGVINGIDVVAGVPDPSLPVLTVEEPAPSVLPPGSICETCWDQPATQLLPAPWGGEMGSCVWCAKGEGEEAEVKAALETIGQIVGVSFEEAQESFRRLGDAIRGFSHVNLDGLVIHPSR